MELLGDTAHANYRLFLSAEPAATPSAHIIPQVNSIIDIKLIVIRF